MSSPITPEELPKKKIIHIDNDVIDLLNKLIRSSWDGSKSIVYFGSIVFAFKKPVYLVIEEIDSLYTNAGWYINRTDTYICFSSKVR